MKKKTALFVSLSLFMSSLFTGCGSEAEVQADPPDPLELFYDSISEDYAKRVMEALSEFGTNPDLGFRTSGSVAELAAAEYLYHEMQDIGLKNVGRYEVAPDSWEFQKAALSFFDELGVAREIVMASYQTQYECEEEEAVLIYVGMGTDADYIDAEPVDTDDAGANRAGAGDADGDYMEIDAEGKLILIDIDQHRDWQVKWPAYQAMLKGAKAVIAVNTGGYFQYDVSTLGIHNICGPSYAPVFTVSAGDGNTLKKLIADSGDDEISVSLTADSRVAPGRAAYSVIGEIPGAVEEVIYMVANYDGFFHAFENNASGVGAALGIAKAIVDSGYEPFKTIRLVFHPAGEWGLTDSKYDWARGAYLTVNGHPEWAEKAFALISFDGGVTCNYADGARVGASWEFSDFAMDIGADVEGGPFRSFEVVCPAQPAAGGFPYAQKGVPILSSGFAGVESQVEEIYRSNMDTGDYLYYEDAVIFAQMLYGTYVMELDRLPIKPLDYLTLFESLLRSVDAKSSPNADALVDAVYDALDAAKDLNGRIKKGDFGQDEAKEINSDMYRISRTVQDKLLSLTWEDEAVFAHERHQRNALLIRDAVSALREVKEVPACQVSAA